MLTIRKNIIPMGILKNFALPDKAAEPVPYTPKLLEVYESIRAKLPHLIVEQYTPTIYGITQEAIGVRDVGSKCYTAIIFHVIGREYMDTVGNRHKQWNTRQCFVVASPRYQTDRAVLDAKQAYRHCSRRFTAYEAVVKEVARLRPISLVEILGSAYDDIKNEVSHFMDRENIIKNALYSNFINEVQQQDKDSFLLAALKAMISGQVLCVGSTPVVQAYDKYMTAVTDATGVIDKDTNQYHVLVAAFKDGDIVCAYYPQKDYRLQGWKNPEMVKYKKVEDMPYAIQLKLNTLEITIQPHPDPNSYVGQQSQEIGGVGVKINDIPVIPECYLIGVANETINELSQNVKG